MRPGDEDGDAADVGLGDDTDDVGEDGAAPIAEDAVVDERDEGDLEADIARGLRQRPSSYGQRREVVTPTRSWWEQKSREALSAEARQRAEGMSQSAIGRSVKGHVNTP